jgi:CheY-like chemotaxis protein
MPTNISLSRFGTRPSYQRASLKPTAFSGSVWLLDLLTLSATIALWSTMSRSTMSRQAHGPVLIVEDDDDTRDAMALLVETAGHPVVTATNGSEALSILRDGSVRPCLILLDVMMPVMNGIEFRLAQLADAALAATPVIVVSAIAERTTNDLQAVAFLRKPINFDELLHHVQTHCDH